MKKYKIILYLIISVIALSCNNSNNPIGPPGEINSRMSQWGMFMHDGRHTGNVNTRLDNIYGPSGDSVSIKWRIPIDGGLEGSPAIAEDGTIYFGTNSSNWNASSVYAIRPDGSVKWRYTPITRIYATPAIGDDGSVYVGTLGGGLYAFSSSGQLKWIHDQGGEYIQSSAAIGKDGTIYYVSFRYIYAFNPSDGSIKWQLSGGDAYGCSPSISSDGTIYYSNNGTITAVNPEGKIKWTYKDSTYVWQDVNSIVIGNDGTVYFKPLTSSPYIYAIDSEGKLKWKNKFSTSLSSTCIDGNDNIYFALGPQKFASVSSLGVLRWNTNIDYYYTDLTTPLTIGTDGIIYTGLHASINEPSILAFRENFIQWKFGIGYQYKGQTVSDSPAIHKGSLYFAWDSGPNLFFYCLQ